MNKLIFSLLAILASGCATVPQVQNLQGEWTFHSSSSAICWDSGPKFERCEIGVVVDAELRCVDAWIKPHEQALERTKVQLDCKIEQEGHEKKLALVQYSFPPREGALIVGAGSDPELHWNTAYGKYRLVHVSHEVKPRNDEKVEEE